MSKMTCYWWVCLFPLLTFPLSAYSVRAFSGHFSSGTTDPFAFGNVTEACKANFITSRFDPTWTSHFPFLNYVMMHKEQFTRATQTLWNSTRVPDLRHSIHEACFYVEDEEVDGGSLRTFHGFSKFLQVFVYPTGYHGLNRFDKRSYPGAFGGFAMVTLSNNRSYNVVVLCYDDGVATWAVQSPKESLTTMETTAIEEHLLALGFSENSFFTIDRSHCRPPPSAHRTGAPENREYFSHRSADSE